MYSHHIDLCFPLTVPITQSINIFSLLGKSKKSEDAIPCYPTHFVTINRRLF